MAGVIDSRSFRHGIRTVELDRTSLTDAAGDGEFRFIVNGEPIFVLGTNWVPLDAYHSRDLARIPTALALVEELDCNMIRCWGGNVYEDDLFFDWCDEAGILVWQDFAMACAIYPQDDAFQAELRGRGPAGRAAPATAPRRGAVGRRQRDAMSNMCGRPGGATPTRTS